MTWTHSLGYKSGLKHGTSFGVILLCHPGALQCVRAMVALTTQYTLCHSSCKISGKWPPNSCRRLLCLLGRSCVLALCNAVIHPTSWRFMLFGGITTTEHRFLEQLRHWQIAVLTLLELMVDRRVSFPLYWTRNFWLALMCAIRNWIRDLCVNSTLRFV